MCTIINSAWKELGRKEKGENEETEMIKYMNHFF